MPYHTHPADGRPQPKGRKVVVMTTLREMMDKVEKAEWRERVPSVRVILESESQVVASERMGEDIELTVYDNGYVIYRSGKYATVFPLHNCLEYVEKDVMEL